MNKDIKVCICENCDFRNVVFRFLDEDSVLSLCENKEERHYRKGEIINLEGDRIIDFKYLKKGLVKIFRRSSNGDEQVITITRPFEFVSNMSIFSEERYSYSVSALEDSTVCVVQLDFMKELFSQNGSLALGLLSRVSEVNEKIISQSLEIRNKNLVGRVAYVLLYFYKEIYNSRVFELSVSRKEIADFISMSTANVIRTMSDFKRDGIINTEGKMIEIIDPVKLEMISRRG
ncbi:MAG: Crp/Fnr family transcriptional regulator [Bacteroidales bacterium]|nr:Crp/Fnr family transcriptional regulator [Bacteroidales bacterium]